MFFKSMCDYNVHVCSYVHTHDFITVGQSLFVECASEFADGHIKLNTPDLFWPPKLSSLEPG